MKKYTIRLLFCWDDENEIQSYTITVPKETSLNDIENKLCENHKFLCKEDEKDIYGTEGRNPSTLLEYTCEKEGWVYEELFYDLDLNFE